MKIEDLGLAEEVAAGHLDAGSPRGTVSWTPFQFACSLGDDELAKELLAQDNQCLVETGKTKYEYAPLHIAARYSGNRTELVDMLIERGAAEIMPFDAIVSLSITFRTPRS